MTLVKESGSTTVATFVYNSRGERDCWYSGSSSNCSVAATNETDYSYDAISRLASINHDLNGTANDVTYCMGTISGGTCTAGYNAASQVLARTISNDAYAVRGQFNADRDYVANGLNQYTLAGATSPTYDANGNLTFADGRTYAYDVENRLASASGVSNATLSYDPLGRLNSTASGGATTRFLYDGDALVGEYDAAGALMRRFVHGSGTDEPLFWYEGSAFASGNRRVLRADHQGSIVAIADSGGNSLGINSYDEWGNPGPDNLGRFAYTGQIILPELGLYHYKARVYSPRLGRFLQTDPVGYDDQFNLYAYVANDPVNGTDPMGWAEVGTKYYETGSRIARTASVTVDADFNNDGTDDLSQGQLNQLGKDFSGFIRANDGADISDAGKLISGDGSMSDKTFTRVVSQFVGASSLAQGWDKVDRIDVSARNYWKFGADAGYRAYQNDPSRGVIFITGSPAGWAGNYLYDSPSNMARALFHETGHTPRGEEYNHSYVDTVARRNLMRSGLGGGGCWSYGIPGAGFPGC